MNPRKCAGITLQCHQFRTILSCHVLKGMEQKFKYHWKKKSSSRRNPLTEVFRRPQPNQSASTGFQLIAPSFPRSSASSAATSSSFSSKSYTFAFEWMRAGVALLGRGTNLQSVVKKTIIRQILQRSDRYPFCRDHRIRICAGSRSY